MDENKERNQNGSTRGVGNKDRERNRDRDNRSRVSGDRNRRRSRSPIGRRREDRGGHVHRKDIERSNKRVYVANVPFDVKWNELKDLFRDKIGNVTYCQMFEDESGKSRGCGLVEFNSEASAQKAIDILHRYEFRGRELVVKEDLDWERDNCGRLIPPNVRRENDRDRNMRDGFDRDVGGVSSSHGDQQYNTYGLSPQFLESLGIVDPLNNRIFIANLDYKVGEHKLEEIFKLAGKVTGVKLYTDASGNSKGHGTVEFEHPVEAVQAISMFHNQKLFGRPLSVRMDKYEADEPNEPTPAIPAGLDGIGKGLGIGGQPLNISKSLLNSQVQTQQQLQQQAQPSSLSNPQAALTSLTALTNLAGNLQIPSLNLQTLNQLTSAVPAVSAASSAVQSALNSGLNLSNFVNSNERSLSSLASGLTSGSTMSALANTSLGSFANNAAQSMLSSLTGGHSGGQAGMGLNHNQIGLNSHLSSSQQQQQQQSNQSQMGGNLSVYSTYNSERDSQFNRNDKYARPAQPADTIIVRNFPQNFSWASLRDRFSEIGEIRYAEMKSANTAIVQFRSDRDATRAVERMNGMLIAGRPLEVSLYHY